MVIFAFDDVKAESTSSLHRSMRPEIGLAWRSLSVTERGDCFFQGGRRRLCSIRWFMHVSFMVEIASANASATGQLGRKPCGLFARMASKQVLRRSLG